MLAWLWLWLWLAAAALIRPLAWEPPYATGAALKRPKRKKEKKTTAGVPAVAQWVNDPACLCGGDVQSPALLNGLRIWHGHEQWWRLWMRLRPGIAVAVM